MNDKENDGDLTIALGEAEISRSRETKHIKITFNVSAFLRRHLCKSKSWTRQLDKFTKRIDNRIHMDPNINEYVKQIWSSLTYSFMFGSI